MIKNFVIQWYRHKDELQKYFETHEQSNYDTYKDLLQLVIDIVLNNNSEYNFENLRELDDGDYQGTLIFVFNERRYQPDYTNYVYTFVDYGSCSGCDTLQNIQSYSYDIPTEQQVKDYMTLCLHMIQRCKYMYDDKEYFED